MESTGRYAACLVRVGLFELGTVTIMSMPTGKQQEPGPLARALSAEIRATIARKRITVKGLAKKAGLSESYLGKRLRDAAPLTSNDVEALCAALGEDLLSFITAAVESARSTKKSDP